MQQSTDCHHLSEAEFMHWRKTSRVLSEAEFTHWRKASRVQRAMKTFGWDLLGILARNPFALVLSDVVVPATLQFIWGFFFLLSVLRPWDLRQWNGMTCETAWSISLLISKQQDTCMNNMFIFEKKITNTSGSCCTTCLHNLSKKRKIQPVYIEGPGTETTPTSPKIIKLYC